MATLVSIPFEGKKRSWAKDCKRAVGPTLWGDAAQYVVQFVIEEIEIASSVEIDSGE